MVRYTRETVISSEDNMDTENRERQAAELMLLTTMYPSEFVWRDVPPPDLSEPNFEDPSFSLAIHPSYTLEFSLAQTYPSDSKPQTYLVCGETISTSTRKAARASLETIVANQDPNVECLDLIINAFLDILPTFTADASQTSDSSRLSSREMADSNNHEDDNKDEKIKQVTIWSHHLLATSKRRAIQSWSRELSLCGYARPGHPGAIFAEGYESDVDEFVRRLKELRWQALQVRAEDVVETRMLSAGDREGVGIVEVESLGEIVDALKSRDEGVARLFLEGMKISGSGAV